MAKPATAAATTGLLRCESSESCVKCSAKRRSPRMVCTRSCRHLVAADLMNFLSCVAEVFSSSRTSAEASEARAGAPKEAGSRALTTACVWEGEEGTEGRGGREGRGQGGRKGREARKEKKRRTGGKEREVRGVREGRGAGREEREGGQRKG